MNTLITKDDLNRGWYIALNDCDYLYNDGLVRNGAESEPSKGVTAFWHTEADAKQFYDIWSRNREPWEVAPNIKRPRYQDTNGEDWIDECARTLTPEQFRGAMIFTIGKYLRRMGKKDDILKEVIKIRDYAQRWEDYEKR